MDPRGQSAGRRIYEDLPHLNDEQFKYLLENGQDKVIEDRTLYESDAKLLGVEKNSIFYISAGTFDVEIDACNDQVTVHNLPSGMTPYDTASM
jgi:hypothetical protein